MPSTEHVSGARRALLIGINDYVEKPLRGCVGDAQGMAALLTERFGFESDQVTLLINREATLPRVQAELARLLEVTQSGDLVFIFYAGHGSPFEQSDGTEATGYGTTLCLMDGPDREDLFDDDFGTWLDQLAARTEHVVLVMDCCHSGTITRDTDASASLVRSTSGPGTVRRPRRPTKAGRIGTPTSSQHVLIAACRDDQLATEIFLDDARTITGGALSHVLMRELRQARDRDTWRDLFERVAPQVTTLASKEKSKQHPQYEGRVDRVLFGLEELRPVSPFRVTGVTTTTVELNAGALQGVVRDMVFTLFPAGAKDDAPTDILGRVQVDLVRGTTCRARFLGEPPAGAITAGARAVSSASDSFARALASENTSPASRLRGTISVRTFRETTVDQFEEVHPGDDGAPPVFPSNTRIGFEITNQGAHPVFLNVFYFHPTGTIERVGAGNTYKLDPGIAFVLGLNDRPPQPLVEWADDTATAHFKFWASTQAVELDYLSAITESVRDASVPQPVPLARSDDWTTVTVPITLQGRATLATNTPATLNGAKITARGLTGTLLPAPVRGAAAATRSLEDPTDALLSAALAAEHAVVQHSFVLESPEVEGGTRSLDDPPSLELDVPDAGEDVVQMAMSRDADGLVRWHLPVSGGTRAAGSAGTRSFVIPILPVNAPGERSLITKIAKTLIDVYVFPAAKAAAGVLFSKHAHGIELRRTPYRVRSFTPDDYASRETATVIDGAAWSHLAGGRSLLMIHGTNSSTHSAFAELPREFVAQLHARYEGRVFAFDHPTLTHTPKENIETLLAAMPEGTTLDVDIICHSRGGLVSRVLAERQDQVQALVPGRSVRVHKVVFVGSPNAGTRLCEENFLTDYLDTLTNLLAKYPVPGAPDIVAGVVMLAKIAAAGLYTALTGIHSMQPGGAFGEWLKLGARQEGTRYFALASNFKPTDLALSRLATYVIAGRVFKGARNDLVVPTDGVFAENGSPAFPIADTVTFDGNDGIAHTRFFGDPRVVAHIGQWLAS